MAEPGLRYAHEQERIRQLGLLRDGVTLCPRCRRPMDRRRHKLDLDDFPPRIICELYGLVPRKLLAHARCNRSHGARLGNALKARGIVRPKVTKTKPRRRAKRLRAW